MQAYPGRKFTPPSNYNLSTSFIVSLSNLAFGYSKLVVGLMELTKLPVVGLKLKLSYRISSSISGAGGSSSVTNCI